MPSFPTSQKELEFYRALENGARRKIGGGIVHPDQCPKLLLHGVEFAIPPRGQYIQPVFADGKVEVSASNETDWPEVQAFVDAIKGADAVVCEKCGQAIPRADAVDIEWPAAFALARKALLGQYELTDEQLADLLQFSTGAMPDWPRGLLRWALGLPAEDAEPEVSMEDLAAYWPGLAEPDGAPVDEPVQKKRRRRRPRRRRKKSGG
jgi:hypothetical protein